MTEGPASGAERSPLDRAIDLLVYAPLGLALAARDELPKLIAKGRQETQGQVAMARVVGRFAVGRGQKEASRLLREASGRLAGLGLVPDPGRAAKPGPAAGGAAESQGRSAEPSAESQGRAAAPGPSSMPSAEPSADQSSATQGRAASAPGRTAPAATEPEPAARPEGAPSAAEPSAGSVPDGLAIPGYDSLSAPHVVQRLDGLSAEELESVRAYEASHRGRKTILSRIAQLQSPSGA